MRLLFERLARDGQDARALAGLRIAAIGPGTAEELRGHGVIADVRGRGLMCALTLPSAELRDRVIMALRQREHVMMLGCGVSSLRVRPALTVSIDEIDRGIAALDRVLATI